MNAPAKAVPASVLASQLRCEDAEISQRAREHIEQVCAQHRTEKARAAALGIAYTTLRAWRSEGLLSEKPKAHGRPKVSTEPIKLTLGEHWLRVTWGPYEAPSLAARGLRQASVTTCKGAVFSMPFWEGRKFVEAMKGLGWETS
jgi:hypothetical protein